MDFSIVIPTFNGKEFLRKNLNFLKKSTLKPLKIIVVDDFSSDGTFEMLKKEFLEVAAIRNEKNLGPTVSRNIGAREAEGKYIIFLDNDVLVKASAIETLMSFAEKYADTGVAGGRLLSQGGEKTWNNSGRLHGTETSWVRESFFLVPKKLFERIGGFDEDFFMFFEGPDLSARFRKIGYKTYFCDASKAVILEDHTHSKAWRKAMFIVSWLKFHLKHFW